MINFEIHSKKVEDFEDKDTFLRAIKQKRTNYSKTTKLYLCQIS